MAANTETDNKIVNIQLTCDTFKPLVQVLKIIALNYNKTRRSSSCSIIRIVLMVVILGSFSVYTLYWKVYYFYPKINLSVKLTDAVQMVYDLCQYIVDLYFVYVYGRDMSLEYIKVYSELDNIIAMKYYSDIKRRLIKLMIFFALIWGASSSCEFIVLVQAFGLMFSFIYALAYIYLLIKILTTLDFISQVMHIEFRLRCISDLVESYYKTSDIPKSNDEDCATNNWFCPRNNSAEPEWHPLNKIGPDLCNEIKWIKKYYLLLVEQTACINKIFGIRILLNSLSLLIDMVRFTNLAVRAMIRSQKSADILEYFPVISNMMRLLTCVAVVISLIDHCESAYRERERIIYSIDRLLIMKDPSDLVRRDMSELQNLVESRPITFHMANFFRFDYSLLASIASVVATYTIIILQSFN